MKLATRYLGLKLSSPLVVGSSSLSNDVAAARSFEDAGAAALVLRPLYEEEITGEQLGDFFHTESHADSFAEAASYAPEPAAAPGPDEYLEHVRRIKSALKIPVIAALSGTTPGGWTAHARLLEQAGADALELHLYHAASDPSQSGADVERGMLEIVREVKKSVRIPVAVKLPPLFTAFAHFAGQLDAAGADGLVLFARFHQVDLDVVELEVLRSLEPSTPAELSLRLRGIAAVAGRVKASLAVAGGVHSALDVVKATMAGAHVAQLVSALVQNGPGHLRHVQADLQSWLKENEWPSLDPMRGNLSFDRIPDPGAYERAHFRAMAR